ncbi:Hypothetical protein NTJ_04627 [Nesidiocoris tenuis]|uniref:Cathepsin propeptide inhibitor domain-containing protein n=1 Tax=Nesidiocoris tenuis TaxID=355587 RepID=A0ABN7AID2_9HEMI|nr:Hypothetical protein NTJ_04627 [Nesidiocoris tenuis]
MKLAVIFLAFLVAAVAANSDDDYITWYKDSIRLNKLRVNVKSLYEWKAIAQTRIEQARDYTELGLAVRFMNSITERLPKEEAEMKALEKKLGKH